MTLRVPTDPPANGFAPWARKVGTAVNLILARRLNFVSATAAYTLLDDINVIKADTTAAAFTITLPKAAPHAGRLVYIKRINAGANVLTIDGDGAETIDGAATATLTAQWESKTIVSDGVGWLVV